MPFPHGPVTLRTNPEDRSTMVVVEKFAWTQYADLTGVTVSAGFITDGASIPRLFWRLIGGPFGPYRDAAVIHDWLYDIAGLHEHTRAESDRIFSHILAEIGIKSWRERLMYLGVRAGGWRPWRRYLRRNLQEKDRERHYGHSRR